MTSSPSLVNCFIFLWFYFFALDSGACFRQFIPAHSGFPNARCRFPIGGNPAIKGTFIRNLYTCCRRKQAHGWGYSSLCTVSFFLTRECRCHTIRARKNTVNIKIFAYVKIFEIIELLTILCFLSPIAWICSRTDSPLYSLGRVVQMYSQNLYNFDLLILLFAFISVVPNPEFNFQWDDSQTESRRIISVWCAHFLWSLLPYHS